MSGERNSARVEWKGEALEFAASLGSGYTFDLGGGPNKKGGSPMEFLLAGVAGCTAIDVINILKKQRQKVTGVIVEVSGARAEDYPMVYTDVDVVYVVSGEEINPSAVEKAIALSEEKYCSASAMFKLAGAKITTSFRVEED
jgi:putative redox protein